MQFISQCGRKYLAGVTLSLYLITHEGWKFILVFINRPCLVKLAQWSCSVILNRPHTLFDVRRSSVSFAINPAAVQASGCVHGQGEQIILSAPQVSPLFADNLTALKKNLIFIHGFGGNTSITLRSRIHNDLFPAACFCPMKITIKKPRGLPRCG